MAVERNNLGTLPTFHDRWNDSMKLESKDSRFLIQSAVVNLPDPGHERTLRYLPSEVEMKH